MKYFDNTEESKNFMKDGVPLLIQNTKLGTGYVISTEGAIKFDVRMVSILLRVVRHSAI